MTEQDAAAVPNWKDKWGDASRVKLPEVGLDLTAMVDKEFYLSVIQAAVTKTQSGFKKGDVKAWLNEGLKLWFESHSGSKNAISADRLKQIEAWVPGPAEGGQSRLDGSLEDVCKDAALSKLLHTRFGGHSKMKTQALKEAVFEHIERTLNGDGAATNTTPEEEPVTA